MRRKRKFINFIFSAILIFMLVIGVIIGLSGCDLDTTTTTITSTSHSEDEKMSLIADFYDNHGVNWLSVEGTSFNISPNKVKEYYYDDDGDWTYHYTMSSVMTIEIDDYVNESCGSTIIFADSRLKKYDIELPESISLSEGNENNEASITTPKDLSASDYWTLGWWWKTKKLENKDCGAKIIVVQSQEGDSICMYSGDEVSWDIPRNLPKTTEITIDDMPLFIHRANFAIIDTRLLDKVAE